MSPATGGVPVGPPGTIPNPSGTVISKPPAHANARLQAPGLVARFRRIPEHTPKRVLSHQIYLPVMLNTLSLTEAALHTEYDTLSAGQFSQPAQGDPSVISQLRDLSIESLTVAWDPVWLVVTNQNALRLRDSLTGILRSRKPVHLLIYFHPHPSARPEIDMKITFRNLVREIRPAENDTHYMTFTIKEWRDARIARNSSRRKGGGSSRKKGVSLPTTHKLSSTDTLDSLAKDYYGSYAHWRLIRDANGIPKRWGQKSALVKLAGRFKRGFKVKIPALPSGGGGLSGG